MKQNAHCSPPTFGRVAPHAGARIETDKVRLYKGGSSVAPHAGARIETSRCHPRRSSDMSLPTRERGLKLQHDQRAILDVLVAPHAGARIETAGVMLRDSGLRGAPHAGARIETLMRSTATRRTLTSLPTRERGLKPSSIPVPMLTASVAPHAGARIETSSPCRDPGRWAVAPHAGARIETGAVVSSRSWCVVAPHAGARIESKRPVIPS